MTGVQVFIHTCPQRDGQIHETVQSVRDSDVVLYEVRRQPEGANPQEFFFQSWVEAAENAKANGFPFVLRLEDDVLVNAHIAHNLTLWGATREADFGAAWLSTPEGIVGELASCPKISFGPVSGAIRREDPAIHAALGVALPTHLVPEIIRRARGMPDAIWALDSSDGQLHINFDVVISQAIWEMKKRVYMHFPLLVAPAAAHSKSTHAGSDRELRFGAFDPLWRRTL